MPKTQHEEKILKLRRADRIKELEVEHVVDLCLDVCRINSLLDIGTGSGLFAEAFVARGLAVQGIDPDPDMIRAARSYVDTLAFKVAAAEEMPFADNAFDACFMGMVLHETHRPARALQEAQRVAEKLVAVLEWPYPLPEDPQPPAGRIRPAEIEKMAYEAGFREVSIHPLQNMVLYRLFKLPG